MDGYESSTRRHVRILGGRNGLVDSIRPTKKRSDLHRQTQRLYVRLGKLAISLQNSVGARIARYQEWRNEVKNWVVVNMDTEEIVHQGDRDECLHVLEYSPSSEYKKLVSMPRHEMTEQIKRWNN